MKSGLGEHDKVDLIILSSDMQNYMGYTLKKVHAHVQEGCAAWWLKVKVKESAPASWDKRRKEKTDEGERFFLLSPRAA